MIAQGAAGRHRPLTFDAGALIAFERGETWALALVDAFRRDQEARIVVPAGAAAQAFRDPPRQARLNALLSHARVRVEPLDLHVARAAGTLCAARGTWDPQGRETLAFQKDRWHRAYLTRMLAESRAGSTKQALVQYAQAALDDYRPRGFPESVAVLEAYFAALDGKRDAALAAAKRVDPAQDDDVEDLYLVVVGLEAGGDRAAAEAVRRAIRQPGRGRMARAIMQRWLDLDARGRGFTPWHAAGR